MLLVEDVSVMSLNLSKRLRHDFELGLREASSSSSDSEDSSSCEEVEFDALAANRVEIEASIPEPKQQQQLQDPLSTTHGGFTIPRASSNALFMAKPVKPVKRKAAKQVQPTIAVKKETVRAIKAGKMSQKQAADQLNVAPCTISKWCKNYRHDCDVHLPSDTVLYRARPELYPKINDYIAEFLKLRVEQYAITSVGTSWTLIQGMTKRMLYISEPSFSKYYLFSLKETAIEKRDALIQQGFEDYKSFKASPQWFKRFRKRHRFKNLSYLVGEAASVDPEAAKKQLDQFRDKVAQLGVQDVDSIYNADETGLFYNKLPNKLYLPEGVDARGRKEMASKDRITIMLCSSASGKNKLPLFVIGKAASPKCMKSQEMEDLRKQVVYTNQASSWMDQDTCAKWFNDVFVPFVRRTHGDSRVVLFWDNAPAHFRGISNAHSNIKILYLPANVTAIHQPMDQGIIAAFKARYKTHLLQAYSKVVANIDDYLELRRKAQQAAPGNKGLKYAMPAHVMDAIELSIVAWREIRPTSIVNCFLKSDCLPLQLNQSLRGISGHALGTHAQSEEHTIQQVNAKLKDAYLSLILNARQAHSHAQMSNQQIDLVRDLDLNAPVEQADEITTITQLLKWTNIEDTQEMKEAVLEHCWEDMQKLSVDPAPDTGTSGDCIQATTSSSPQPKPQEIISTQQAMQALKTLHAFAVQEQNGLENDISELIVAHERILMNKRKVQKPITAFFTPPDIPDK